MASPQRRLSSGASRPRKECRKFKLLGSCENGDNCRYSHDVKLREDQRYVGYVPFPERLPISMAIGRHASNLSPVYQIAECVVAPSERNDREVKVVTTNKRDLEAVKRKLEAMFAQIYPLGPAWCYLHTEGITEVTGSVLEFREYHGRLPIAKRKSVLYEVCCHPKVDRTTAATPDTSVEDLEKQFSSMHLESDTVESQHSALDTLCGTSASKTGKQSVDEVANTYTLAPHNLRARITLDYQGHIREQLQGGLEWFLKNRDQSPGCQILKLEARFGKVLWGDLPEDVLACQEPMGVKEFAEFVFSDVKHTRSFNTDVKPEIAAQFRQELSQVAECKPTLETFDLKITLSACGEKLDVRLKVCPGGRLEVVVIRMSEQKLLTFDILCLHRKHDLRMSLNKLQVVSQTHHLYAVVQKMLGKVTYSEPGTLTLIPCTQEWDIHLIRHKKRTSYVLDEKYITTVSSVDEYTVDTKHPMGRKITIKPEDYSNHIEVEFHSIVWECAFGKDIGYDPAKSLALYMDQPTVDHDVAASIPHPWDAAAIVQELDEIFENLETLNEFLGKAN